MDLKEKFIKYSISHGDAILLGDSRKANQLHKQLQQLYAKIKDEDNICLLEQLLLYPDDKVKFWAAGCLLPYSEKNAKNILNKIAKRTDILSVSARLMLDMWKDRKAI